MNNQPASDLTPYYPYRPTPFVPRVLYPPYTYSEPVQMHISPYQYTPTYQEPPQTPAKKRSFSQEYLDYFPDHNQKKQRIDNPMAIYNALSPQMQSDNGKRRWDIIRSLGKGGCGEVYLAKEESSQETVALKIDRKQFLAELDTMKRLNKHASGRGLTPRLITAVRKKKAIVMEYLSDTLSSRFEKCGFKFTPKTILMLAIDMTFLDKSGQVHVDLKPSNFCTGLDGKRLFLIDFGYSTPPTTKLPGQTGTPLFMSWSIQNYGSIAPCLQDDIESIGYIFLMAGGKHGLPWGAFKSHKDIACLKNDHVIGNFCQRYNATDYHVIVPPLLHLLKIARDRKLEFNDTHFEDIVQHFKDALEKNGWMHDAKYDWLK
ncbi:kinase-like domain-containing protein [Gorgonomyces haynaldii]|nr:kinase-like domain-containing protein [Gorgonomyces haynaldii]